MGMTLQLGNGQHLEYQVHLQGQGLIHLDLSHRGVKVSEEKTQNIYMRWYNLLKNNGRGASLKPIRSLEVFALEELHELIWLLHEQLKVIDRKKLE